MTSPYISSFSGASGSGSRARPSRGSARNPCRGRRVAGFSFATFSQTNIRSQAFQGKLPAVLLAVFWCLSSAFLTLAADSAPAEQARTRFAEAQKSYSKSPKDAKTAWQFGRACFDLAEFATGRDERAELAQKGIEACRKGVAQDPNSGPSHYYLGLNLGQLARTRSLGALKLVDDMEKELSSAARLDSAFDYGGADRSLGLLYRDAPTMISIGNRAKSREHLRQSIQLAPEYPENRLDLIETYLKWGDRVDAKRELGALEEIWPKAREKYSGASWTANWKDWDAQLETLKKKMDEGSKLEAPRH